MGSFERKLKKQQELKEQQNIKNLYGKKPKGKCPKCKTDWDKIINQKMSEDSAPIDIYKKEIIDCVVVNDVRPNL